MCVVTIIVAGLAAVINTQAGMTILSGGMIAICGQAFYNMRALKHYGTPNTGLVLLSASRAMWGKWLIIISATTAIAVTVQEFNAAVLYASVFGLHTLGALLLPVLVKKSSQDELNN